MDADGRRQNLLHRCKVSFLRMKAENAVGQNGRYAPILPLMRGVSPFLCRINRKADHYGFQLYGIVTDGKLWEFGKLAKNMFFRNAEGYTVHHLAKLFGAVDYIFRSSLKKLDNIYSDSIETR